MSSIWAFLRLMRFQNLLIIALTQYLMRWCIIFPMLENLNFQLGDTGSMDMNFALQMTELDFFLLVLSTVMIAAAGNIINDYFDLKIDRINKPEKIIVGRLIKRRVAMGAHIVINTLAMLIGLYVSWKVGHWELVIIHVFSAISLWYYATTFKRQLLVGNLVIAMLAGIIPIVVGLYEVPMLNAAYKATFAKLVELEWIAEGVGNFNLVAFWLIGYGCFAFLITLAREITKDIADIKGDEKYGCRTIPIVYGVKASKTAVGAIYVIMIAALVIMQRSEAFLDGATSITYYIYPAIVLPLIVTLVLTSRAKSAAAFNRAANFNKLTTLLGILSAGSVAWYILKVIPELV